MALTIGCLFVLNGVDRLGVEALPGAESGKRHRTPLTPGLTIRRSRPLFPEQPQPRQPRQDDNWGDSKDSSYRARRRRNGKVGLTRGTTLVSASD